MDGMEGFQTFSKEQVAKATASFDAWTKGMQAVAAQMTEGSRKALEANQAFVEKLTAAKTLDRALEVQTDYAKQSYESFVAQATKVNELVVDMAKGAVKPFEIVKG